MSFSPGDRFKYTGDRELDSLQTFIQVGAVGTVVSYVSQYDGDCTVTFDAEFLTSDTFDSETEFVVFADNISPIEAEELTTAKPTSTAAVIAEILKAARGRLKFDSAAPKMASLDTLDWLVRDFSSFFVGSDPNFDSETFSFRSGYKTLP